MINFFLISNIHSNVPTLLCFAIFFVVEINNEVGLYYGECGALIVFGTATIIVFTAEGNGMCDQPAKNCCYIGHEFTEIIVY